MAACLQPISIPNPKTKDRRDRITVPCGHCVSCLQRRSNGWSMRLEEEMKVSTSAFFVTLTYDENHIPINEYGNYTLVKKDLQLFMKRLRKHSGNRLRYYAVGEYGSITERPHYHMILFNLEDTQFIVESWDKGFVKVGSVNPGSIRYTCKYIINVDKREQGRQREFALMSRRGGIGKNYLTPEIIKYHKDGNYTAIREGGVRVSLPRFYVDKIHTGTLS